MSRTTGSRDREGRWINHSVSQCFAPSIQRLDPCNEASQSQSLLLDPTIILGLKNFCKIMDFNYSLILCPAESVPTQRLPFKAGVVPGCWVPVPWLFLNPDSLFLHLFCRTAWSQNSTGCPSYSASYNTSLFLWSVRWLRTILLIHLCPIRTWRCAVYALHIFKESKGK